MGFKPRRKNVKIPTAMEFSTLQDLYTFANRLIEVMPNARISHIGIVKNMHIGVVYDNPHDERTVQLINDYIDEILLEEEEC